MNKVNLKKTADQPGFNSSFMTTLNIVWFHEVMKWLPDREKPIVFLPCAAARKTRGKNNDSRKFISHSTSHQFLSAITRNEAYELIILSEPLTIIPYALEAHELRPDYNLPVDELSIQSEWIFIHQLSLYLLRVKNSQPTRKEIFYVGARHHYFILHYANELAGNPFEIIYKIPSNGIRDYASAAKEFNQTIQEYINTGELTWVKEKVSLTDHLKSRGRYTDNKFWTEIKMMKKNKYSEIPVCDKEELRTGFEILYNVGEIEHA